MEARLRAELFGVRGALAVYDLPVKGVLDEWLAALAAAPDARDVRLVEGEERLSARVGVEVARAEAVLEGEAFERRGVRGEEAREPLARRAGLDVRLGFGLRPPRPSVAEPEVREQVERRVPGAAVEGFDADENVLGRSLRVLDEDIEVAVFVEHARVEQFVLRPAPATRAFMDELGV